MILYILYIEPLLQLIKRSLRGIRMGPARIVHNPYVNYENVWIMKERDIIKGNKIMKKFEGASGAILLRSEKCKLIGFGLWKNKMAWPLEWIQTVKETKIFGLMVCQSLQKTAKKTWDKAVSKMAKQIGIWSTRELPTLWHREKVISTYITSKLWYRAAILPVPKDKIVKIESKIRNFLWLGTLERVRKGTSNLPIKKGGLGLPIVSL